MCSLHFYPGRGGEGRHGESETGQQKDPLQSAPSARGPALPNVQPQEHGEMAMWFNSTHSHLRHILFVAFQ